jgi:hypothetical protein
MADTCPITGLKNILVATDGSEYSEKACMGQSTCEILRNETLCHERR